MEARGLHLCYLLLLRSKRVSLCVLTQHQANVVRVEASFRKGLWETLVMEARLWRLEGYILATTSPMLQTCFSGRDGAGAWDG